MRIGRIQVTAGDRGCSVHGCHRGRRQLSYSGTKAAQQAWQRRHAPDVILGRQAGEPMEFTSTRESTALFVGFAHRSRRKPRRYFDVLFDESRYCRPCPRGCTFGYPGRAVVHRHGRDGGLADYLLQMRVDACSGETFRCATTFPRPGARRGGGDPAEGISARMIGRCCARHPKE